MKILHLGLADTRRLAPREHVRQSLDSLLLPLADMVGVNLMAGRDLLDRLVAPQCLKSDFRLELVREIPALAHLCASLLRRWDTP